MTTREFDLGDVLSITTGRLLSPRGMEAIYDILNFMTGDSLYTHQLPRGMDECKPFLLAQHPQLMDVTGEQCPDGHGWKEWVEGLRQRFGATLVVSPIPSEAHEQIDPVAEIVTMLRPDQKLIVIEPGDAHQEQGTP